MLMVAYRTDKTSIKTTCGAQPWFLSVWYIHKVCGYKVLVKQLPQVFFMEQIIQYSVQHVYLLQTGILVGDLLSSFCLHNQV